MRKKLITISMLICLFSLGCSKDSNPEESAGQTDTRKKDDSYQRMAEHTSKAVDAAGDYLAQQKEKTVDYFQKETVKLQENMADLKKQAQQKSSEVKQQFDQHKEQLDQKLEQITGKLDQAKQVSAEKWDDFQKWFDENMDKAVQIYNNAQSTVKQEN